MSIRHSPGRQLLLVALAAVGRRNAARMRAAGPVALGRRPCASCKAAVAAKGCPFCGPCRAKFIAQGSIAPCSARWFTWSPLAGHPKAMAIAPWVASSDGADRLVFS